MVWPPHLAQDVRFDHAAAADTADELRRLASLVGSHAADRGQQLASATHFEGGTRRDVGRIERQLAARALELVSQLRAEADDIEDDASSARSAATTLDAQRGAWLAQQRREQELAARRAAERARDSGHGR